MESLIVMCKKFKTIFVCVYRPPSTKDEEWNQAVDNLNEYIDMAELNSGYNMIIFTLLNALLSKIG